MWLPYDERRLLAAYVHLLKGIDVKGTYHQGKLGRIFVRGNRSWDVPQYGDIDHAPSRFDSAADAGAYMERLNRVIAANRNLEKRNLLILDQHVAEPYVVIVTLTVDGYDLGRQYKHWLSGSGLWFAQYKDHWLWLLAAFLGAAVATQVIDSLLDL
ncbi:MAG: hypothetical protein H0T51_13660 [Pirellulales bacterium]|nr:hypothetical protein [Pirellulales bacterium]